jgi:TolA-binding protein
VLANKADFLALQGNTFASAVAYLEAEKNGGTNPSYLLKAGQLLVLCSQLNEAVTTFEKLKDRYYGTKEALLGSIDGLNAYIN